MARFTPRPGHRGARAASSRIAGSFTRRRADAQAGATSAHTAGRSGPRRCALWAEVASNSSRLTVQTAPGARWILSYSRISGPGSVPTAWAMARMCPRA